MNAGWWESGDHLLRRQFTPSDAKKWSHSSHHQTRGIFLYNPSQLNEVRPLINEYIPYCVWNAITLSCPNINDNLSKWLFNFGRSDGYLKSYIQPLLDYGITYYGCSTQKNIDLVQRVHNHAARLITWNIDHKNCLGIELVKSLNLYTIFDGDIISL